MLGNHADAFYLTPMPTRITSQAVNASRQEMPMPRPMNASATRTVRNADFLPGLGNADFLPGLGAFDLRSPTTWVIGGVAIMGALWLLGRKR